MFASIPTRDKQTCLVASAREPAPHTFPLHFDRTPRHPSIADREWQPPPCTSRLFVVCSQNTRHRACESDGTTFSLCSQIVDPSSEEPFGALDPLILDKLTVPVSCHPCMAMPSSSSDYLIQSQTLPSANAGDTTWPLLDILFFLIHTRCLTEAPLYIIYFPTIREFIGLSLFRSSTYFTLSGVTSRN